MFTMVGLVIDIVLVIALGAALLPFLLVVCAVSEFWKWLKK